MLIVDLSKKLMLIKLETIIDSIILILIGIFVIIKREETPYLILILLGIFLIFEGTFQFIILYNERYRNKKKKR